MKTSDSSSGDQDGCAQAPTNAGSHARVIALKEHFIVDKRSQCLVTGHVAVMAEQLEQQLSEMELLSSMFPTEEEFVMHDPAILEDVQRYIDGKREAKPKHISFSVMVQVDEPVQAKVAVLCSLPHQYPDVVPEVFVRCTALNRETQKQLNDDLAVYILSLERGEPCITTVVMWVQENGARYLKDSQDCRPEHTPGASRNSGRKKEKYTAMSRLWIYSHHIYRKELLKKIPESAKELDISGFCLPGKPGIICAEGFRENCDEYWRRLRYPNWKHISCKHREDVDVNPEESLEVQFKEFRLFTSFEELAFEAHGDYGLRNDYHMDLGQFLEYLKKHNCEYVFSIFFGLEGKTSAK